MCLLAAGEIAPSFSANFYGAEKWWWPPLSLRKIASWMQRSIADLALSASCGMHYQKQKPENRDRPG